MQVYRVGGSVRDELLGLPGADEDFVVVGGTADQLLALGYRSVGKDFPVFLHPRTQAEYALARRERKVAAGHRGFMVEFGPEVTLQADLSRRDLSINAMARDEAGQLIDPFGGQADLQARRLRHVSPAFAEDPLRVLRVARFAARFPDFEVADDTLSLMRQMVHAGGLRELSAERVWQELAKGLLAVAPQRMLRVLEHCGAMEALLPELAPSAPPCLARAGAAHALRELAQRYALLFAPASAAPVAASARWRVPREAADLASLWHRLGADLAMAPREADEVWALLHAADVLRRPQRFVHLLEVVAWAQPSAPVGQWQRVADLAAAVPAAEVLAQAAANRPPGSAAAPIQPSEILRQARCDKIATWLSEERHHESR
jgi:tRNA nucleotidyltransferase (CCA-adding enzyme)